VAGLTPEDAAELAAVAESTGLVVRQGDGGLLVGGRPDTLQATAMELPDSPAFAPLVDAIDTTL
jgi:hypothetical protein